MNNEEILNKQKIAKQLYSLKNKEKEKQRKSLFYQNNKERLNKERCERRRKQKLRESIG